MANGDAGPARQESGDNADPSNYRGITLQPVAIKLLCHLIHRRMQGSWIRSTRPHPALRRSHPNRPVSAAIAVAWTRRSSCARFGPTGIPPPRRYRAPATPTVPATPPAGPSNARLTRANPVHRVPPCSSHRRWNRTPRRRIQRRAGLCNPIRDCMLAGR